MRLHSSSALLALVLGSLPACSPSPHGFSWGIDFADPGLRARATLVEAEVRSGGCNGEPVHSARLSDLNGGPQPTHLGRGRYGFYARARDAECVWFAAGCAEASLPTSDDLTVLLQQLTYGERDPSCAPGDQSEGAASAADGGAAGHADAGEGARDAASDDGGSDHVADDAGTVAPGRDAGDDAGLPGASRDCAGLTPDVVACYDFNASLADASRFHNDAQSDDASFEILGDDRAVRVQGAVVSVMDASSLDLQAMTLELWVRIDSLSNAWHQPNEMSILVDKDKQYLAGFTIAGAPTFSVYDGMSRQTSITAADGTLQEGKLTYLAFTYDGATMGIYVDGQRVSDKQVAVTLGQGTGTMHIGTGSPDGTKPFNGLIDALRISDRAHSDDEICARAGKELVSGTCS